jgi:hypothetical protein
MSNKGGESEFIEVLVDFGEGPGTVETVVVVVASRTLGEASISRVELRRDFSVIRYYLAYLHVLTFIKRVAYLHAMFWVLDAALLKSECFT